MSPTAQKAFPLNIAEGIDHQLMPYVFPSTMAATKDCGSGSSLLPGAKLDNQGGTSGNGANCIKGDTGNDGPKTYDGLVAGVDGHAGRLDASRGATSCPSRSNLSASGKLINNDTLDCFLRNGATKSQIASDTGVNTNMLDPAIKRSPRFVYLPVVYANDRAQKGFQPIQQFVPGFITARDADLWACGRFGKDQRAGDQRQLGQGAARLHLQPRSAVARRGLRHH